MVLGIEDPWIWGVYVLIILSTLLCVVNIHSLFLFFHFFKIVKYICHKM